MPEVIGTRGQTYVHPDLAGIGAFYQTILTGNRLPEGEHSFSLGRLEIPTGPFRSIETTLTIQSLTEDNQILNNRVAQAYTASKSRPKIIVLPKDLPGYIIKTDIIQREPRILFSPPMVATIRDQLKKDGLEPKNNEPDNIIMWPPNPDDDLKFRIFFPNRLDEHMHANGSTEGFTVQYYTFPRNVLTPRLASVKDFKEEADLYFYGLDTILEKLYGILAAADPLVNIPNITLRLKAPPLNVIDL